MNEENNDASDDLQKTSKGALTATALAVGVGAGATASTAVAQTDDQVVVPGHFYYPDVSFDVITQYSTSVKNDILESYEDEFDDLTDWDVYAIRIDIGGSSDALGMIFSDEDELEIEEGDSGTFEDDAAFRNADRNLLEVDSGL